MASPKTIEMNLKLWTSMQQAQVISPHVAEALAASGTAEQHAEALYIYAKVTSFNIALLMAAGKRREADAKSADPLPPLVEWLQNREANDSVCVALAALYLRTHHPKVALVPRVTADLSDLPEFEPVHRAIVQEVFAPDNGEALLSRASGPLSVEAEASNDEPFIREALDSYFAGASSVSDLQSSSLPPPSTPPKRLHSDVCPFCDSDDDDDDDDDDTFIEIVSAPPPSPAKRLRTVELLSDSDDDDSCAQTRSTPARPMPSPPSDPPAICRVKRMRPLHERAREGSSKKAVPPPFPVDCAPLATDACTPTRTSSNSAHPVPISKRSKSRVRMILTPAPWKGFPPAPPCP